LLFGARFQWLYSWWSIPC